MLKPQAENTSASTGTKVQTKHICLLSILNKRQEGEEARKLRDVKL